MMAYLNQSVKCQCITKFCNCSSDLKLGLTKAHSIRSNTNQICSQGHYRIWHRCWARL